MHVQFSPLLLILIGSAARAADQPGPASAGNLLQVLFGLIVVLGLMAAAAWALKRFGAARMASGAPVKIIGGVAVGSRERIMVVEVADQWIVVGVAPGRISTLSTMPRQESAAAPAAPQLPKTFSAWLKQTIEKRNGN
jgi:flagellar protein FliO/FliZ